MEQRRGVLFMATCPNRERTVRVLGWYITLFLARGWPVYPSTQLVVLHPLIHLNCRSFAVEALVAPPILDALYRL